jgi:hypothetical protein
MPADPEIIPADDGSLVSASRARRSIELACERSPVQLLGKSLIRALAENLEIHRKEGRSVITPGRLAIALRRVAFVAVYYTNASTAPPDLATGFLLPSSERSSASQPNVKTAEKARKMLASVRNSIDRIERSLEADEIAAFNGFSADVLVHLRAEVDRLEASVDVPPGLRRNRSSLRLLVSLLHDVLFNLTGSWLRLRSGDEEFLPNVIHRILKPMVGDEFSDEDIGRTIETEIRMLKPKRQEAAT